MNFLKLLLILFFLGEIPAVAEELLISPPPSEEEGEIRSNGSIQCGGVCSRTFDKNTSIRLTAKAKQGYVFEAWRGACLDFENKPCTLILDEKKIVGAVFRKATPPPVIKKPHPVVKTEPPKKVALKIPILDDKKTAFGKSPNSEPVPVASKPILTTVKPIKDKNSDQQPNTSSLFIDHIRTCIEMARHVGGDPTKCK